MYLYRLLHLVGDILLATSVHVHFVQKFTIWSHLLS